MRAYNNIELVEGHAKTQSVVIVKRKNLHFFSALFMFILSLSCLGFSFSSLKIAGEVRHITSYWAPNLTGLGKLKFVSDGDELYSQAAATVEEFSPPFENSFITKSSDGIFMVNGLGGMVVKACLEGVVSQIKNDGTKKSVTISHASNLKTVYEGIDTLGVKEGNRVDKNTPIGVCEDSFITFKILYKNKLMGGITISDGEFSFL